MSWILAVYICLPISDVSLNNQGFIDNSFTLPNCMTYWRAGPSLCRMMAKMLMQTGSLLRSNLIALLEGVLWRQSWLQVSDSLQLWIWPCITCNAPLTWHGMGRCQRPLRQMWCPCEVSRLMRREWAATPEGLGLTSWCWEQQLRGGNSQCWCEERAVRGVEEPVPVRLPLSHCCSCCCGLVWGFMLNPCAGGGRCASHWGGWRVCSSASLPGKSPSC